MQWRKFKMTVQLFMQCASMYSKDHPQMPLFEDNGHIPLKLNSMEISR